MFMVSALQMKAARAMLDWSQEKLADVSGLGLSTIRRIEEGNLSPRTSTNRILRSVIESNGLELIESDGIKRRNDALRIIRGEMGCKSLCEDIAETIKHKGGDISIILQTKEALKWLFDAANTYNLDFLNELTAIAPVKCLLHSMPQPPYKPPAFEYRMVPRENIDHLPNFIYGNKFAVMFPIDSFIPPQFILCTTPYKVRDYRDSFDDTWKAGQPISVLNTAQH